ncbi:OX-2 membrane glycoprotein-like [Gouania willdenowi]|uniref:OX-2 membrane glycoprotein-like n=1 Tax=Gouania willdenowi TaxID=441366 RepID=A0A8C5ETD6_GOUWI|nr:OX-2 membrane glycoprotein-like [Gouania willdenowi]XP_028325425.1 OX-2 membrane glycoprotein-like [Gouania willdenowi]XP_028325436.1 OX-2 membrane glycoprotein-like [Gouania willdenowi]XP_028325445.1 OX-2 membrane glycoprotein-like [Gouania willdenowi]XP_028325451.1 OX-2 membrane glycoprotein-like [Gouania willdenowi]
MWEPALPFYLLLWMGWTVVLTTQSQVLAPSSLTAEAGEPLLLHCNISIAAGDSVRQVRWVDKHAKLILAYEQSTPPRISHQDPNVLLSASHHDASYITIRRVGADDKGCYRCLFDVFPQGEKGATTCVSVTAKVRLKGNRTAVSGKPTTLTCSYSLPDRIHQVLWRKTSEQGHTSTVASYTKYGHHAVQDAFRDRVTLSRTLEVTQLTIQQVKTEDEACYTCDFHTYPDGTRTGTACLSVYVLPKAQVTHVTLPSGITVANCTARSRPAANITWNFGEGNRTLGSPTWSVHDQGDGTTTLISTLLFQSELLSEASVECIVQHPGLDTPLKVQLNTNVGTATVIILSVCGVAAVLLLGLCGFICKCFVCTDD